MSTDRISQMYPDTEVQEPHSSPPVNNAEVDDFGYEEPPEKPQGNPYALPEDSGSVTDDLYGAESKVKLSEETDLTLIYSNPEDQAALNENLGYIASEAGASQEDLHDMVSHVNEALITGEHFDVNESMKSLYEQHGADLQRKLDDARTLVASFPDLAAWLDQTGMGNSPMLINKIIKLTETNRAHARLQKLRTKS